MVLRRLVQLVGVLLVVTFLSYLLLNLVPGNTAVAILGPGATKASIAQVTAQLHLNQPLPVRYVEWLGQLVRGNLGQSYLTHQPVAQALGQRLPCTIELIIMSQIIALVVAVPLGIAAALRPGGWLDNVASAGAFGFLSLPPYVLGYVLVLLFAVDLHLFPATGYTPLTTNVASNLHDLVLPSITLAVGSIAVYLRVLRAEMIATLQEDYITMAVAKGMPTWRILTRHAFRPSTIALVTVGCLNVGALFGGTFLVEVVFSLPGVGSLLVESISSKDYLVVQAITVVFAVAYVLLNFLADLAQPLLDPRLRTGSGLG